MWYNDQMTQAYTSEGPTADELLQRIALLPDEERRLLQERVNMFGLNQRQRRFVEEYVVNLNPKDAARAAGLNNVKKLQKDVGVQLAVEEKLQELAAKSELKAEYVRNYILSILELCPTDYFTTNERGEWMIQPELFRELPQEVKRLVDTVELKIYRGEATYSVKFISKQAALAMAARYTLVQKFDVKQAQVPWDELAKEAEKEVADPIGERLKKYELLAIEGPVEATEISVAEDSLLRQADRSDTQRVA